MTRVGLLAPGADATRRAVAQLGDGERLRRARVHPIAVLAALKTYAAGRGVRGSARWAPVAAVIDALDAAFYASFGNIEPSGKRLVLALDVSGSMSSGMVAGVPGLTPRVAAAAMALVTAATEPSCRIVGFSHELVDVSISPRQRLDDVLKSIDAIHMGATDCALPMLEAVGRSMPS
jgi:60 kDa SS-A/Ro ribonucleoprotein